MPVTGIQILANHSEADLIFVKLEDRGNNRYAPKGDHRTVGDCHVPWCSSSDDFLSKTIIIVDQAKGAVVGYVWQDKDNTGDDRVRFSTTGWQKPSSSNRLAGESGVGQKINLVVSKDFSVQGEKYD